ncbi:hypothetical protein GE061_011724 [Apolygus lucorum]|uniref:Uncharacterized protein n=1 Tax=Apolygus lucorum TaxID=248454 RepID=A0A6A4JLP0_APOLU|nr:hypothetical protein GE061_011724 [Apolygus lucorum]
MTEVLGLAALASGRRVRIRPIQQSGETLEAAQQSGVEYYAEQEQDEDDTRGRGAVLVSRQDNYGRANGQPRLQPKLKPAQSKEPPVQTIRNYNKLNDDGSFTFGYEAADGSFKEETRGTDCVVRGKYGYVDPDGNKREFTYVSGNPCDPNAVQEEDEEPGPIGSEENVPQNIPARRPIAKAARPVTTTARPRPTTTVFQQSYGGFDDASGEEEENLPPTPSRAPVVVTQRPALRLPTFAQAQAAAHETPAPSRATPRPKLLVASPPARQSINITPRPTQPPATTYRPQLVQFSSTPASAAKRPQPLDLDEELKNFQLEHNVIGNSRPRPDDDRPQKPAGSPIYTSELVYDPASGQYNTVLYQQLPQTQGGGFSGDFNLRGRLQSFVPPQQQQSFFQPRPFAARPPPPSAFQPSQAFNQPTHAYSQPAPNRQPQSFFPQQPQSPPQQAFFQQQQASQLQQSQQLYASQQKKQQEQVQQRPDRRFPPSLLAQEPQRFGPPQPQRRPEPASLPLPSQPFYYVSPAGDRQSLSNGQIDAFLRGHSIAI